jgi:3-methylfumaryl-CoA hydratase
MATSTLDLDDLKRHIGRQQVSTDVATAGPANLLRLALGRPEPEIAMGAPVPPGWQILYFLPSFGPEELRPDGSPRDAGVVPPMPLPRRMFAGERMTFHRPIRIGDPLRRETELADIALKAGGTGTLVFATVRNRIFAADALAMEEERRTVFREEVKSGEKNQAPRREEAPADVPWRRRVAPDAVLLFRFSALTFNSHRIHSAIARAMEVEGYPGLVVHGPPTSTLPHRLLPAITIPGARSSPTPAQARPALRPRAPSSLRGRPTADGQGAELWAVTPEGTVAMSAQATFRNTTSHSWPGAYDSRST